MDSILLSLFERLLDEESKRQQVPLDTAVAAQEWLPRFKEVVMQEAYEAVATVAEARESLPSWESPNGDVPSMAELRGQCR
tara:strand:- start:1947 stop:2189 length:243 start_codon:yes stop_codon:yes gene_type:complete